MSTNPDHSDSSLPESTRISRIVDVPGKLLWFNSGTPEYQLWVNQRNDFMDIIESDIQGNKEILNDILDAQLNSEIPTGWVGIISYSLKITKKVRDIRKRRRILESVIVDILQRTFSITNNPDGEFVFRFSDVQHIWRTYSGDDLPPIDYKKLFSIISTKLSGGKIHEIIIQYPQLMGYVEYKLRQFRQGYHNYLTETEY